MARPKARRQRPDGRSSTLTPAGRGEAGRGGAGIQAGLHADTPATGARRGGVWEMISFAGWHLLMTAWLLGWLLGLWTVWPSIAPLELNGDLLGSVFWLVTGAVAWVVALMLGLRRYYSR